MYRGRFAPTPSGPLHLGSLVAAVGSYLDANAHNGQWFVRIEDVDKPRAIPGAADTILRQLEDHGLTWHGEVIFQSDRDESYQDYINSLTSADCIYQCDCSRKAIRERGGIYDGYCRTRQPRPTPYALRYINSNPVNQFNDRALGVQQGDTSTCAEDFVVKRRDGLYAYQLAVVVDDIEQGITDIVRGSDLVVPSFWQLTLWQHIAKTEPRMMHLPLVTSNDGRKLSKQNHAPAINSQHASDNLLTALNYLGIDAHELSETRQIDEILAFAVQKWRKKWHITPA